MRPISLLVAGAVVLGLASLVRAQGQGQPLPATTVQLPTFSVFTVQTTVSVPDGGGSYLGGLNRGADSRITRGPLGNRGLASTRGASGVSVGATIIDREEMDRSVLAAAARRAVSDPTAAKAAELTMAVARSAAPAAASRTTPTSAALPGSVAALRERNAVAADERAGETAGYFAAAQKAEADGKLGVAKVYYQMVARRDSGQLKQHAEARLAALRGEREASASR